MEHLYRQLTNADQKETESIDPKTTINLADFKRYFSILYLEKDLTSKATKYANRIMKVI